MDQLAKINFVYMKKLIELEKIYVGKISNYVTIKFMFIK